MLGRPRLASGCRVQVEEIHNELEDRCWGHDAGQATGQCSVMYVSSLCSSFFCLVLFCLVFFSPPCLMLACAFEVLLWTVSSSILLSISPEICKRIDHTESLSGATIHTK